MEGKAAFPASGWFGVRKSLNKRFIRNWSTGGREENAAHKPYIFKRFLDGELLC